MNITISISVNEHGTIITLNYLDSKLSVVSAANVACTLGKAICDILSNPRQLISQLDLFTQRDFEQIRRWNSAFPDKIDSCVHDLLLQHAKESPHSPALCSWDGDLTYDELDKISMRLAHHFINAGIGQEVLVPVCFKKSMYTIVAMVAVLRAGGAFIPLDPSHPGDRLKAIIQKANAKFIIASPDTAHLFVDTAATVINVSLSLLEILPESVDSPLPYIRPHSAAFVLFTSGSTGKPKGIVQEHASVCTSAIAHGRALHVSSTSRVLQYAAYTFDVSMMDIFTTLIYGGCVCTPSEEDRMSNITQVMNAMRVNYVLFTPSVASLITPEDVPGLQTLALGGEAVTKENIHRWAGKVQLLNCYGPAECAASTIGELKGVAPRPGTIGRAFGCGLCWVADPINHNRLVPIGAVGELLVEGPTLARGYLDDVEKTKAAFIKSPTWLLDIGPGRPRRIYKTGDLVRQNSDGSFDFVGRKDLQFKIRGQRVELGEVEHSLSMYPGIAMSMAAYPQSGPYSKSLVGVLQLRHETLRLSTPSAPICLLSRQQLEATQFIKANLSLYMESRLPKYMVPNHWLVVEKLPLSVSGKIDRKLVDAWLVSTDRDPESSVTGHGYGDLQITPKETIALELSAEVASMAAKGNTRLYSALYAQNFLLSGAGLDSIQLISLSMYIRRHYGTKIHLDTLVHPAATVRSVASCIEGLQASDHEQASELKFDFWKEFQGYQEEVFNSYSQKEVMLRTVFMTGATGFLGSQIVSKLCIQNDVRKIILHVRAESAKHGLQRFIKSATLAGWWSDFYLEKLEIWVGDLGQPRLGITADQWDRLCGKGPVVDRVTAIIHNGAVVHWNADFSTLKPANVDSTMELLKATSESSSMSKFVYVSGGQQLSIEEDNDHNIAEEVVRSNGYAQTKFLSEMLVKEFSRSSLQNTNRVSVVKPGYIIGSVQNGIASVDDFIWRLTASCIDIKGYNDADAGSWLFISDVGRVAAAIVSCCDANHNALVVKILDGVTVSEFWNVLREELGYELFPLSQASWMHAIQKDIEAKRETHQLWPLIHTIEKDQGKLGSLQGPPDVVAEDTIRVKAAIKKNVEFLSGIGFLPKPNGERRLPDGGDGFAFSRSLQVSIAA